MCLSSVLLADELLMNCRHSLYLIYLIEHLVVTSTTVGYGDLYCTTPGGRIFACACTFLGIVVIAMPVTVLGTHFSKEYEREYFEEDKDESHNKLQSKPFANCTGYAKSVSDSSLFVGSEGGLELGRGVSSMVTSHSVDSFAGPSRSCDFSSTMQKAEANIVRLEGMANELQRCIIDIRLELNMHKEIIRKANAAALSPTGTTGNIKSGVAVLSVSNADAMRKADPAAESLSAEPNGDNGDGVVTGDNERIVL
jgi:hypothetical protein